MQKQTLQDKLYQICVFRCFFFLLTFITKSFQFSDSAIQSSEENSLKTFYKIY